MFTVTTEQSFDSAHFLSGYNGKCKNIHGHRWTIIVEVGKGQLDSSSMVVDFTHLKKDLKEMADYLDHSLIIETGTLKPVTYQALQEEDFRIIEVPFRPTAECFAKYFFDCMTEKGYSVIRTKVYETPNNCATYEV